MAGWIGTLRAMVRGMIQDPTPQPPSPRGKGVQIFFLLKRPEEGPPLPASGRGRGRGLLFALLALLPSALFAQDLQIAGKIVLFMSEKSS